MIRGKSIYLITNLKQTFDLHHIHCLLNLFSIINFQAIFTHNFVYPFFFKVLIPGCNCKLSYDRGKAVFDYESKTNILNPDYLVIKLEKTLTHALSREQNVCFDNDFSLGQGL